MVDGLYCKHVVRVIMSNPRSVQCLNVNYFRLMRVNKQPDAFGRSAALASLYLTDWLQLERVVLSYQ
jgi:hypothetical protein